MHLMEKPRALIVGAAGFLGAYLVQAATDRFEVIRGERFNTEPGGVSIDITDASSVDRAFEIAKPDAVLLLAAISDIDRCEAQPEQAVAVNVRGPEIVANACARMNARFLFTSTAAVFDGRKHGYREEDDTNPLSVYGTTKARAEAVVRALVPVALIIRISLVLGFAKQAGTNSMLDNLHANWKAGKAIAVPTSEFRNPVHAHSLSEVMTSLIADRNVSGIFHAGARDSISRYEMARRLASHAGFPDHLVQPQRMPVPGRAPRGKDHFLLTEKVQKIHPIEIPTCDQVIERCFDGIA
jgi:dTDP-4-dehydrorhamnose reductase